MKTDNLITKAQFKLSVLERLQVCRDMVDNNIDLNKVKRSYVHTYDGKTYKIGAWLSVVRHANYSQEIKDALIDMGFSFDNRHKMISTEDKVAVLSDMLKKGVDINNIHLRDTYEYNGTIYNVGRWLSSSKYYGADPVFSNQLQEWGFDFSRAILNNVPLDKKMEVFQDMIDNGRDINTINRKECYIYKGIEYPVGEWIIVLRDKRCGKEYIARMKKLGFKVGKIRDLDKQLREEVLTHMKEQGYEISEIKHGDTYEYQGKSYPVGTWTHSSRIKCKSEVLQGYMDSVHSTMIKRDRYSVTERFAVLDDMVKSGIDINSVPSNAVYTYKGNEYKVGSWLAKARSGQTTKDFIEGLAKYNFDYSRKTRRYTNEFKLAVVRDMVKSGIDLNKCNVHTTYAYEGVEYDTGTWIFHARRNIVDQEFVAALENLGLAVIKPEEKKKLNGKSKKLEVLRDLQSKGADLKRISRSYKHMYQGKEYPVGKWLHNEKRPDLSQILYESLNLEV